MYYARLTFAIITWIVHEVLCIIPWVAGLILCIPAIALRQVIPSPINGNIITTAPDWLWLYGNDEDGYASASALATGSPSLPAWLNMYIWAALRNPMNNLRFIKAIYPPPVASRIAFNMTSTRSLTWQGWRYHFAVLFNMPSLSFANRKIVIIRKPSIFTVGWKYYPTDKNNTNYGWRAFGCGFALRIAGVENGDTVAG